MPKEAKVAFVKHITDIFSNYEAFVLIRSSGIAVSYVTKLRFNLYTVNARLLVTKNRLTRVGLHGVDSEKFSSLTKYLVGPMSVAFSNDIVSLSKVVCDFISSANVSGAQVVCGMFKDKILDNNGVERMSKMPSADEMRASIVSIMSYGPQHLVKSLQQGPVQLIVTLNAYLEQLKS